MQIQLLVWIGAVVALPVLAQIPSGSAGRAEDKAVFPTPRYQSPFADYRAWSDPELLDWRKANDEAGVLGGHMGHVRGQAGEAKNTGAAVPPSPKLERSK